MLDNLYKTIDYDKNFKINIYYDSLAQSPREIEDNYNYIFCLHRKYFIGDKHDYKEYEFNSFLEFKKQIIKDYNPYVILPIYMLDHSGIKISTSSFNNRWDSGMIGFIFTTREQVISAHGKKLNRKKIIEYLEMDIQYYSKYIEGENFYYEIINKNTNKAIDSVGGFIGEDSITEYAFESIKSHIKVRINSFLSRKKVELRNRIPLLKRTNLEQVFLTD